MTKLKNVVSSEDIRPCELHQLYGRISGSIKHYNTQNNQVYEIISIFKSRELNINVRVLHGESCV